MWTLTRQIRFNLPLGPMAHSLGQNGFAGIPPMQDLAYYFALDISITGDPDTNNQYLADIRQLDLIAREIAIPLIHEQIATGQYAGGMSLLGPLSAKIADRLKKPLVGQSTLVGSRPGEKPADKADSRGAFKRSANPLHLLGIVLHRSPFQKVALWDLEKPMVRLSQKFEFSAAHRLHNPALTDNQNQDLFGKCNNPHGHGHNYELEVTLVGKPDDHGLLIPIDQLERIVQEHVIDHLDHRHLNQEVPEFQSRIPSVENIAQVIYQRLELPLKFPNAHLAAVTVWETPKTSATYSPFPTPYQPA